MVKIVVGITFVLVLWVEMLLYIILELPICLPVSEHNYWRFLISIISIFYIQYLVSIFCFMFQID